MGCPLQPDLVNTSCSVDCAPDAVLACGRAVHLTRELACAVPVFIDLPAQQLSPSIIQSRDCWRERELTYWLRYEILNQHVLPISRYRQDFFGKIILSTHLAITLMVKVETRDNLCFPRACR